PVRPPPPPLPYTTLFRSLRGPRTHLFAPRRGARPPEPRRERRGGDRALAPRPARLRGGAESREAPPARRASGKPRGPGRAGLARDRKSTRLHSSHQIISY